MKKNLYGYDQELNRLVNSQQANDFEVLKVRGKIIKSISKEIKRSENKVIVLELKERLKEELILYKQQVKTLLKDNKKSDKYSMSRELSLKGKQIKATGKQIKATGKQISNSLKEAKIIKHLGSITLETLSVGFTFLKMPVVLSINLFKYATPVIVYIFTLPVHLAYYIKHKLVKENSPYNGQKITNVSKEITDKIESNLEKQQGKVKRL